MNTTTPLERPGTHIDLAPIYAVQDALRSAIHLERLLDAAMTISVKTGPTYWKLANAHTHTAHRIALLRATVRGEVSEGSSLDRPGVTVTKRAA